MNNGLYCLFVLLLLCRNVVNEDLFVDCNDGSVHAICKVDSVRNMPWVTNGNTAPRATFLSSNWFLYEENGLIEIGLNVTWYQNAGVFDQHIEGYVLELTSSMATAWSSKWIVNADVPSARIRKYENMVFNYHGFYHNSSNFFRNGRTYFIQLFSMPVYNMDNAAIYDSCEIDVPDCSNPEIAESSDCEVDDYDESYNGLDIPDPTTPPNDETTQTNLLSFPKNLLLYIGLALSLALIVVILIFLIRNNFKKKKLEKGPVLFICTRDSNYGEVASCLASFVKKYSTREVECNMWHLTDQNILEWLHKWLGVATDVVLIYGQKERENLEEGNANNDLFVLSLRKLKEKRKKFHLVGFEKKILREFPKTGLEKKFLFVRDLRIFFRDIFGGFKARSDDQLVTLERLIERAVEVETEKKENFDRDSGFSSKSESGMNEEKEWEENEKEENKSCESSSVFDSNAEFTSTDVSISLL
ncbi:uncharacterized protein LOC100182305 [Ciona intestinalis]